MSKSIVTELEVLFTTDTSAVDRAVKDTAAKAKKIEDKPVKQKVDGDVKDALAGMGRVEAEAKKIVSAKTVATVDANIERAEKNLTRTQERLDYLRSVETDLEVTADITRAEKALERAERQRDALVSAKSKMEVDADTAKAQAELKQLTDTAKTEGREAGKQAGSGLVSNLDGATRGVGERVGQVVGGDIGSSLEDALTAIPVAGGIILAGVAIGKAIVGAVQDGLNVELGRDRLQALTGLDPAQAARMADAAAEAYASVFGESIEANMDTARLALQFDLIQPEDSRRSAELVIQGLAGIADVLGEDVLPVARAVTTMLRTGLVKSADEAFDVLAAGQREGVNLGEDLLDTFNEYGSVFASLGISGSEALGLLNQGLKAGARNSDVIADGLLELRNLTTDMSDDTRAAFDAMGLSAEETAAKIAAGGPHAREGLDQILDGLRGIEDPLARNAAGIDIFGTKWEDTAGALGALDLTNAVDQLDGVAGAARTMFDTLADNDATKMEEAKRNIEVAADGIKGALAAAFSEPLSEAAEWISSNRGPLLQFFQDLVNGAIDFAVAANTGIGDFVSGPLADMLEGLAAVIEWQTFGLADTSGMTELADGMRGFGDTTDKANEKLEGMREKFNGFADAQVALGFVHDAAKLTASAVAGLGVAADGSKLSMEGLEEGNLQASDSGKVLHGQIVETITALDNELAAAAAAGEGQGALADRYAVATDAIVDQLVQMGFTEDQARDLINTYAEVPGSKSTAVSAPGATSSKQYIDDMKAAIDKLPAEKQSKIRALLDSGDVSGAERELNYLARARTATVYARVQSVQQAAQRAVSGSGYNVYNATGGVLDFMAAGGIRGLNPMQPIAQMVPPNSWRVVGDRGDVPEAYIPLDGSARSLAILLETIRRFGGMAMAGGGIVGALPSGGTGTVVNRHYNVTVPKDAFRSWNHFEAFLSNIDHHAELAGGPR
ncbi:phage tail tape measure protein [Tessaracoccus sp. MC1627]|uniref:phage tail tape measure protein n=1 Tax=Tessaracoccus sp. MC1627 TaxID=2760312 RepID=UPI0016016F75|nr:phage tail tape measure protein [Tessaracoccus sp. MC1627]MBB1511970.1 phage tail tape measure protein [Tessaracoccus sp. MC1627]